MKTQTETEPQPTLDTRADADHGLESRPVTVEDLEQMQREFGRFVTELLEKLGSDSESTMTNQEKLASELREVMQLVSANFSERAVKSRSKDGRLEEEILVPTDNPGDMASHYSFIGGSSTGVPSEMTVETLLEEIPVRVSIMPEHVEVTKSSEHRSWRRMDTQEMLRYTKMMYNRVIQDIEKYEAMPDDVKRSVDQQARLIQEQTVTRDGRDVL